MPKPLSPEETEVKKLEDAEALEDAYRAKERRKECPVAPKESKECLGFQWLGHPISRMTARCQRCGGLSHLDGEKCMHDTTLSLTEPAFGATGEEAPWYEEDSVHAEMLRRQIVGETRCGYEFCTNSSKHRTAVCPELHLRCQTCNCRDTFQTLWLRGMEEIRRLQTYSQGRVLRGKIWKQECRRRPSFTRTFFIPYSCSAEAIAV
jgi:hypothetical protein